MKTVIIGNGCNAVSVATKLRRRDEQAEIVILANSQEFAVAKCGLSYLIDDTIVDENDLLAATPEPWWRLFRIKVRLNTNIIEINSQDKLLLIENAQTETYDKLVFASDAITLKPDIKGVLGENIFTVNSLQSVERIKTYFYENKVRKVLILGSTIKAFNFAEVFCKLGAEVIMVDSKPFVLQEFDAVITDILEKTICNIHNI